jgi:putative membrane protein
MHAAARANTAEIEIGKLAQKNGGTWGRGFGRDMAREHGIALADLRQLAKHKGVSLPTGMDAKHQQLYSRLSRLRGQAFDNAYRDAMIKGHMAVLNTLHREMQNGHDSMVRNYAVMLEPGVKLHHKLAVNKDTMLGHG